MKSLSPLRGTFWVLVAVMSVFVMASSSPQCARSNDLALNPTLQNTGDAFGFCKQECIDQFQLDKKDEQARHKDAIKACNGDIDCKQAESDLHNAIIADLVLVKDACIVACEHQQGAGLAGQ